MSLRSAPLLRLTVGLLVGLLLAGLLGSAGTARAAQSGLVRVGVAPRLPRGAQPLSGVRPDRRLRITLALTPRDPGALAAYAAAVSDPTSPDYRHFLTVSQFARRFGPRPAVVGAVRGALSRAGLRPGPLSANRLSIPVLASAGTLERGLHVQLARVELSSRRAAMVNTQAPALPAAVAAHVQAVIGLDGLATMGTDLLRPRSKPLTPRSAATAPHARQHRIPAACAAASGAAAHQGAYTANQIATAYSFAGLFAAGDEGAGVNIGVYELEPNLPGDIAAYQACYGTDTPVSYQSVDGGAGSGAGSGEAAFDIEQVVGLAPRANVIVYQAPNSNTDTPGSGPYDLFSTMISQDRVSVITNSWGECEAQEGLSSARAEATLFQEAAVQGQTIISAAGDTGSEDCLNAGLSPNNSLAVDDPGSQPDVTDVGGTSMTALGPPPTEVTWNDGGTFLAALASGAGAGGGGISSFWSMPAYQSGAPAALGVVNRASSGAPCGASGFCREVPDVSADAAPNHGYIIYYNGDHSVAGSPSGWQATGGTSGAAPVWAAAIALADADRACAGVPIGFANPALYRIAATGEGSAFHDVTSGNNDFTGANHGSYPATQGYDMATGLGTPDVSALAGALCAQSLRLRPPASFESFIHIARTIRLRASDAPGVTVSVRVGGLPAGVRYAPATATISGAPRGPGTHVVRVTARASDGVVRTASFVWDVAGRPRLSDVRLSGTRTGRALLSLHVNTGRDEAPLRALTLTLPPGLSLARAARVRLRNLHGGRGIAHSTRGRGRRVTILLRSPASAVAVIFAADSLRTATSLRRSGRRMGHGGLGILAVISDSAAGRSSVRGSVTPTS